MSEYKAEFVSAWKEEKGREKWREDFPFEFEDDEFVSRRDFIRFLAMVSAGLAVGNAAILVKTIFAPDGTAFPEREVASADELTPGSWKLFQYPDADSPSIMVRRESGELIAFQQKCPHLACPVTYQPSSGNTPEHLSCHCHNGKFDISTGKGVAGPPRELRPLRVVLLKARGGRIFATGLAEIRKA